MSFPSVRGGLARLSGVFPTDGHFDHMRFNNIYGPFGGCFVHMAVFTT